MEKDLDFYDDGKVSKFNEALLQMLRIHFLQSRMHQVRTNPLLFDPTENAYGYQIWLSCLEGLFSETFSKLSLKKKAEGNEKLNILRELIVSIPIKQNVINKVSNSQMILTNNSAWNIIRPKLFEFELTIKERAKIFETINYFLELKNSNLPIKEKLSKHLGDGIFELRSYLSEKIARTLYFYQRGAKIIITHGFVKKTQKTPRNEIKKAKDLRDLYNKRLEND